MSILFTSCWLFEDKYEEEIKVLTTEISDLDTQQQETNNLILSAKTAADSLATQRENQYKYCEHIKAQLEDYVMSDIERLAASVYLYRFGSPILLLKQYIEANSDDERFGMLLFDAMLKYYADTHEATVETVKADLENFDNESKKALAYLAQIDIDITANKNELWRLEQNLSNLQKARQEKVDLRNNYLKAQ